MTLHRHRSGRAPGCSKNRAPPSALRARSIFPAIWAGQRNLRNSRARDFKSSASTVVSVGMGENINDEARMSNLETNSNIKNRNSKRALLEHSSFGSCFVIRYSDFEFSSAYRCADASRLAVPWAGADSIRKMVSPSFIRSRRSRAIVSK